MLPDFNPFGVFYLYIKKNKGKIFKYSVLGILSFLILLFTLFIAQNIKTWEVINLPSHRIDISPAIKSYIFQLDLNFPYREPGDYSGKFFFMNIEEFKDRVPLEILMENNKPAFPLRGRMGLLKQIVTLSPSKIKKAIVENLIKARLSILRLKPSTAKKMLLANVPLFEAAFYRDYKILEKGQDGYLNRCYKRTKEREKNPYCFLNPAPSKFLLLYRMEMHLWLIYSFAFSDAGSGSKKGILDLKTRAQMLILKNSAELFYSKLYYNYLDGLRKVFVQHWGGGKFLLGGSKYREYALELLNGTYPLLKDFDLNPIKLTGNFGYFDLPVIKRASDFYFPAILAVDDISKRFQPGKETISQFGDVRIYFTGELWKIEVRRYLAPVILKTREAPSYYDACLHFLIDYWNLKRNVLEY